MSNRKSFRQVCVYYNAIRQMPEEDLDESLYKKLMEKFVSLCETLMIDKNNLKSTRGNTSDEYSFSDENAQALAKILLDLTSHDGKKLRQGRIDQMTSISMLEEFERIVRETMQENGRSQSEIEMQLSNLYYVTDWSYNVTLRKIKEEINERIDIIYNSFDNYFLRRSDMKVILDAAKNIVFSQLFFGMRNFNEMIDFFSEYRWDEIGDAGVKAQEDDEYHKYASAWNEIRRELENNDEYQALLREREQLLSHLTIEAHSKLPSISKRITEVKENVVKHFSDIYKLDYKRLARADTLAKIAPSSEIMKEYQQEMSKRRCEFMMSSNNNVKHLSPSTKPGRRDK